MAWPVYIQWATNPMQDFVAYDAADWSTLPKKPEPVGGEVLDALPGWINRCNIQGLEFPVDHISLLVLPNGNLRATMWYDTTGLGNNVGFVWELEPLFKTTVWQTPQGKLTHHGPVQHLTIYARPNIASYFANWWTGGGGLAQVFNWNQFQQPAEADTRHGFFLPDPDFIASIQNFPSPPLSTWGT